MYLTVNGSNWNLACVEKRVYWQTSPSFMEIALLVLCFCSVVAKPTGQTLRSQFWTDFHEIDMVRAGPLMGEPYCFWKQSVQKNRRYRGKCAPKTSFSSLSQMVWSFLRKKLKNCMRYHISSPSLPPKKGYIHFYRPTPYFLKNGRPPPYKKKFNVILETIVFFKKIVKWKIFKNLISYKKGYIDFCRRMPSSLQKVLGPPEMIFCLFLGKYGFLWKNC